MRHSFSSLCNKRINSLPRLLIDQLWTLRSETIRDVNGIVKITDPLLTSFTILKERCQGIDIIITLRLFSKPDLMPGTLRVSVLMDHLDKILDELSVLWCDVKNFEHLAHIELISQRVEKIVKTLKYLES